MADKKKNNNGVSSSQKDDFTVGGAEIDIDGNRYNDEIVNIKSGKNKGINNFNRASERKNKTSKGHGQQNEMRTTQLSNLILGGSSLHKTGAMDETAGFNLFTHQKIRELNGT